MQLETNMILQVSEVIFVLLLSIVITLAVPKVRQFRQDTVKMSIYIVMGIILFILVGMGYNVIQEMSASTDNVYLAVLYPYTQFFPLLILSIAIACIVLVTYMEGERFGLLIAGTAFAAMLPDMFKYAGSGRFDLFLLGCVIWALIPTIWVLLFRKLVFEESTMRHRIWAAVSASLISYVVYVCTALIAVFGEVQVQVGRGAFDAIAQNSGSIIQFILISLWFFVLLTVIVVSLMFVVHDLALNMLNLRRVVRGGKVIDYEVVQPPEEIVQEIEPVKVDAYKSLIDEMTVFCKYMDKVDRLRAASTIARFKQEYVTLAARHGDGSKAEADRLIKMIDQEFKKRY